MTHAADASRPAEQTADPTALMMVLAATAGLALKGVFGRFAFEAGLTVAGLVFFRLLLALPLFWGVAAWREKRLDAGLRGLGWREVGVGALFGAVFLVATLADFQAVDQLGAGVSRVVLFTYPMWVTLMSAAMERRRPPARQVAAFCIAYAGLVLLLWPKLAATDSPDWSGVGWSLLAAVSIAAYYAFGQPAMRRLGSARFSLLSNIGSCVGVALVASTVLSADDLAAGPESWLWIALIITVSTVAPMLLLYEGMMRIGAARAAIIALFGPVITVAVAWATLGESLSAIQILGVAVVLLGVAVLEKLPPFDRLAQLARTLRARRGP